MKQVCKHCRLSGLSSRFFGLSFLAPGYSMPVQADQTQILQEQLRQQDRILQPRQQQDQAIERQRQLKAREPGGIEMQTAPVPSATLFDRPCFEMRHILLNGAEALSANTKSRLKVPYLGRCIGMASIQELVRDTTN